MKRTTTVLLTLCVALPWASAPADIDAQDNNPMASKFVGKWTQHTAGVKEGATMSITSVDPTTGQIKGNWIPPTGPAAGKEFDLTGWVSSAAPIEKADNVIVVSFSVSLTTYGSVTAFAGFLKDNQIITLTHNVRPNSRYEWDHITANQDTFTKTPK